MATTTTATTTLPYYRPDQSGHWRHSTIDIEQEETYEAISDLLGVRVPIASTTNYPTPSTSRSSAQPITTVEIRGQPFRVPDPKNKEFYRDLTYLEDEEIIQKYNLVPCPAKDFTNGRTASLRTHSIRASVQNSRSGRDSLRSR